VNVIEQPIKVGWHEGNLWLEVHPSYEQVDALEESYTFPTNLKPASRELAQKLIQAKGADVVADVDWGLVQSELVALRGLPVQITGRYRSRSRAGALDRTAGGDATGPAPRPLEPPPSPMRPTGLY